MLCELCKREIGVAGVPSPEIPATDKSALCETCADAVYRLVVISRRSAYTEVPLARGAKAG